MINDKREKAKSRNFSLAFEKMCNFVAIANTRDADETLRQLILQCFVVLPDERFDSPHKVMETIDVLFGLQIPEHWFQSIFEQLVKDELIKHSENNYVIAARIKEELQRRIDEAMVLEERVKQDWFVEIITKFPTLSTEEAWSTLRGYLARAFRRHGIQTAALLDPDVDVAPEYSESLSSLLDEAVKAIVSKERQVIIKEAVSMFFADVGHHPIRAKYITQLGDGAFNYFSLIVAPDTADQFRKKLQPLTLFFDTNFLFGVLDLHVNPLVQVSHELLRFTEKCDFPFSLQYHEATEKEMGSTIHYYRQLLSSRNWSRGLSKAATMTRCVSGIVAKYHQMNFEKGMDVDTFFSLYEHADVLLKSKNILLYKQEVQREEEIIQLVNKYKEFLRKWNKEKPERIIEHDMTVLDTVRKLRSHAKSSIEAEALLITCDYLLYRFDWENSRQEGRFSCVVLPNLFWQILRPFVPADLDFERSFAETFALPEFRTLGSGASEACSKLLCLLAVYKDISEETAVRLLSNDLLINRLRKIDDDKQFQEYVESAIISDNASLIEERAAMAKQLEIERIEREAKVKEFREQEIKYQKEKDKIQRSLLEKEEEIQSTILREQKAREELERQFDEKKKLWESQIKEIYATILGAVSAVIGVGIFFYVVNKIQWVWLLSHQNSYGLQGAFCVLIAVSVLGFFKFKWRKWLWSVSLLAGIVFIILSLLGGPKK